MKQKSRLIILICAAVVLSFFIFRLSVDLLHQAHELHRPNQETRQIGEKRINGWMTPEDIAERYHISDQQIFQALQIEPAAGDEKLSLRKLQEKYHISNKTLHDAIHNIFHQGKGGDFDFDK
ncbi:MAG: hypothetical protein H6Q64_1313 [Firmicutes bacterium]|nr:hypothetical protein [Bacillota bacterium]